MNVRVRLFASFREAAGTNEQQITLPDHSRVSDLVALLEAQYPSIRIGLQTGLVAVNHEYVDRSAIISPGDEVALIPPVSGGQ